MNGFAAKGIFERDLNVVAEADGMVCAASRRTHSEYAFKQI
jgi:hypothetical protein